MVQLALLFESNVFFKNVFWFYFFLKLSSTNLEKNAKNVLFKHFFAENKHFGVILLKSND